MSRLLDRLTERQTVVLVLLIGLGLYVPFAGSYGLWDPWETHYGEVARQMAKRNDFISLWWAGSPIDADTFWSKPVLTFWILALSFKIFGVGSMPGSAIATSSTTEWAMRLPFALLALTALYGVYLVTSRFVSRRAGVLAAVALATMPMFSLIARNAMTDMPFVGPMTLALALAAIALFEEDDTELPRRTWRRFSWPHHPLFYVTVSLFLVCALPQLVVNSVQLRWRLRPDLFLPGVLVMLPYLAGLLAFVRFAARTRYKAPFYLHMAAILCGLAILAKGLAGLGLPAIVFLAYLLFTWNWRRLTRAGLLPGLAVALLGAAVVAIPWHHAMLVRHGFPFWDELYGDNHWRRLVSGRHGDRGSFEYFLRELGYAVLPWIAVAPSALAWVVMRPFRKTPPAAAPPGDTDAAMVPTSPAGAGPGAATTATTATSLDPAGGRPDRRQEIFWFGAIWFVAGYTVVSMSMTKFHHYILPALPGLAIAIGCFLDDVVTYGRRQVVLVTALVGVPLLILVTHDLVSSQQNHQHFIWLFSYDYVNAPGGRPWPQELDYRAPLIAFSAVFGLIVLLGSARRLTSLLPAAMALAAMAFTVFLLDVYVPQTAARWSQKGLIRGYYEQRKSPDEHLVAWQLYWRGETFYTGNEIFEGPTEARTVFLGDRNAEMLKEWVGRNRGKRAFFVVERARFDGLRDLLPTETRPSLRVLDQRNNKFYLAVAQL